MKNIFLFLLGLIALSSANAQGSTQYFEEPSIRAMEEKRKEQRSQEDYMLNGYRVFINLFSSRKAAADFEKEFNYRYESFGSCVLEYDEPNFKAYAGTYVLKADAQKMLNRVKQTYPTAKIIRVGIPKPEETD